MCAKRSGKGTIAATLLRQDGAADLVESFTAISFRNAGAQQSNLSCFLEQFFVHALFLCFEFINSWNDFVFDELLGGLRDHAMLFGKIFGRENVVGRDRLNQEAATLDECQCLFCYLRTSVER